MIGKILGNRYEIIEKIGTGGMSVVYKAKCRLLNRNVAIKILKQEFIDNEEFVKRFKIEAQAAASLTHPNIVSIFDVGNDNNLYYIVMEYVEGITLKEYISNKKQLDWKEAVRIAIQICSALETAHKNGIVHRDVKPHNIIITPEGVAKVTDFGIARAATYSTVTFAGNAIGSVHYFSPEQARGGYTDNKSDIYSLGVVLYEMLTGRVPFDGDSPIAIAFKHIQQSPVPPNKINESIPASLNNVVMKAMAKSTDVRYSSATEMLNDLKEVLQHPEINIADTSKQSEVDSPTLVMPAVNKVNGNGNKITEDDMNFNGKQKNNKPKISKLTLFSAVGISLVIVAIISFFAYKFIFNYQHTADEVPVPNLIGKTEDEARLILSKYNLTLVVKDRKSNDDYLPGVIFEQTPSVGMTVKIPNDVEVVVSTGKKEVSIPNVENSDYREAKLKIERMGLIPKIIYKNSETVPIGFVIETNPSVGRTVERGTEVEILVSNGPALETFAMPDLIGKTEQEAKEILQEYKLKVGNITYEESSKKYGSVIKQSVNPNDNVTEGTEIDITLSAGSASELSNEIPLSIPLPQDKKEVNVEVIFIDNNGNRKVIYPKTRHSTSQSPLIVYVTGEGKGEIAVYINDILSFKRKINFEED